MMNKYIRKISIILFVIMLVINLMITPVLAVNTITLQQIADKINSSDYSDLLNNSVFSATATENELIISTEWDDNGTPNSVEVVYNLNGTILSTVISTESLNNANGNTENSTEDALKALGELVSKTVSAGIALDAIGQLHGYAQNATIHALNSEETKNYTLANEGLEYIQGSTNSDIQIQVDLSKKFPIPEYNSTTYIENSDLENGKDYIMDGSYNYYKGKLLLHTKTNDTEATIIIGEKDNLTEETYKSVLSVLEVMFDKKDVADYFQSEYSSLSQGNKEFIGFKIEVNPTKDDMETTLLGSNYSDFVRITIDKEKAKSPNVVIDESNDNSENQNSNVNSNNTQKDTTASQTKLPQTGINDTIIGFIVIVIIVLIITAVKYQKYKDIK
ncbi:MAG: hypothetical protein LBL91_01065 [Lachnospiraceae bacterium]|nr:hypothetical protein [Lachnospiraceae bacterium]